jgi:hypothetical protein
LRVRVGNVPLKAFAAEHDAGAILLYMAYDAIDAKPEIDAVEAL